MRRRTFVGTTGATVGLFAIAGCTGPDDGGVVGDGGDDGAQDEETVTPTETPTDTPTETPADDESGDDGAVSADGPTVAMKTEGGEYIFDPVGLHVEQGETVTWELESGTHSSTAYDENFGGVEVTRIPEGAGSWDSGTLSEQGATFEHTFETAGTYDYFCTPHKTLEMVGRIVVDEPGGPAEGSMPPDGEVPESETIVDRGSVSHDEFHG